MYISGSPSITIKESDLATFVNPSSVTIGATVQYANNLHKRR